MPQTTEVFVLHDDAATVLANDLRAQNAVRAHAEQNYRQSFGAKRGGCGTEQGVDGGAARIFRAILVQSQVHV
jgi:hypothetical protein